MFLFKKMLFVMVCVWGMAARADVTMSVEPNPVLKGETVSLVFAADSPFSDMPDLAPLVADFSVVGQQQRSFMSTTNGVAKTRYELAFTLAPKKTGDLTVSGLFVGSKTFDPITVTVRDQAAAPSGEAGILELTANVSQNPVYEGESVRYVVKLVESVGITDGEILPPVASNATVARLGDDQSYGEIQNNQRVRVFERSYLITPSQPGRVEIKPAEFRGFRPQKRARSGVPDLADLFDRGILFDGYSSRQSVFLTAPDVLLSVRPKPADWQGWWLPSPKVSLTQTWQKPDTVFVGEAFERTLVLTAEGVAAADLPVPQQLRGAAVTVYPGTEVRNDTVSDAGVTGQVRVTVALVPTQVGEVEIPAVRVPWFNTLTGQKEVVEAPAFRIQVLPAPTVQASSVTPPTGQPIGASVGVPSVTPPTVASDDARVSPEKKIAAPDFVLEEKKAFAPVSGKNDLWVGLAIGLCLGFLGMAALFFALHRRGRVRKAPQKKPLPDLYPFK